MKSESGGNLTAKRLPVFRGHASSDTSILFFYGEVVFYLYLAIQAQMQQLRSRHLDHPYPWVMESFHDLSTAPASCERRSHLVFY